MSHLLSIKGLQTFKNPLNPPEGGLLKATNVVIDEPNVAECRRGFKEWGDTLPLTTDRVAQLIVYKDKVFRHFNTTLQYATSLGAYTSFTGAYAALEAGLRIKGVEASGNLYFTTTEGIKKISAVTASDFSPGMITNAGGLKALDFSLAADGSTGWLPSDLQVAYRILWGTKDLNSNLIYGAPSGRVLFTNTPTITHAVTITTDDFVNLIAHGFANGTEVYFKNIIGTTDISSVGTKYYVVNAAADKFQLTLDTSGAVVPINTAGTATLISRSENPPVDVQITLQVPAFATDDYFIQVYRTAAVDTTLFGGVVTDAAGDEMQLVDEFPYDGTSNPVISVDRTLEEFQQQGDYLYTNQNSGEGLLQANDRPPIAKDIALFRNSLFFANTKTTHKYELSLLSAEGLDTYSFAIGNSTLIRIYVFEEYDSTTDPNPSVANLTGGIIGVDIGGSPAQNIDQTARNLIQVINQDETNPVTAYYLSTDTTLPGQMIFENDVLTDLKFYLSVDNVAISAKFDPDLPVTLMTIAGIQTSTQFSDNEVAPNRVYFSKYGKPEAVPATNWLDVGTKDKSIYRILALRDSLFVLKEDGVFVLTGTSAPNFSVRLLDNSAPIIAPDSAAVLNNKIYCLSAQGIIEITETGIQVRSFEIENIIKSATREGMNFKFTSVGVGSENDRSYLLWLPEKITDTVATQCLRYNTFTNTWVRWEIECTAAVVNTFENKLYLGAGDRNRVYQERKSLTRFDYADREFTVNILDANSLIGNDVILNSTTDVEIHDALVQTQYVTISFFNRLLKKLDFDSGLADNDYFSTLEIVAGNNLQQKLTALDLKLQNDANIGTYVPVSFSSDFATQQTELNVLIGQLNNGVTGTAFKDYKESIGTVYYESLINAVTFATNRVTLDYALPLLFGDPVTIYKSIPCTVQWSPQHFGAADQLKQVAEGTIIVDKNNFSGAELRYKSDLSPSISAVPVTGRGIGVWGMFPWGETNWGGEGNDAPFRTFIPRDKQRCRYLTVEFFHDNARNTFRLIGLSLIPRLISPRGYNK